MLLHQLAEASRDVARVAGRLDKVERLATALRALPPAWGEVGVAYLAGDLPQGRIGVGPAAVQAALGGPAATSPSLTLADVHGTLDRIAATQGPGSVGARARLLRGLFARGTALERDFLVRLLMGDLRQGAQEGVLMEALARASGTATTQVRRAAMLRGGAARAGGALLGGAVGALEGEGLELFRPIQPMLAQTSDGPADALARLGQAAFEIKFDGARVQVHRTGDTVRVFTRGLNEIAAHPGIVEVVRALPARELVLDGEAIVLQADGTPRPFQETMRQFGGGGEPAGARGGARLTPFFFDLLYLDGEAWIDRPAVERWSVLDRLVPSEFRAPRLITDDRAAAERMLADARARGHEGLMAKALDAPYVAGRRGSAWLKVKPCFTADLVVLAAEWGHGRRTGWLSNLHLGARGDAPGEWVMVGKTFKGMTDALLAWQTERLLALGGPGPLADARGGGEARGGEVTREPTRAHGHVVRVPPHLVVEIAFDGVQASSRYPGGLALRFARVKGYRDDKTPAEADSAAWLRELRDRWR